MSILETTLEQKSIKHLLEVGANPLKRGQDGEPDREVLWGGGLHFWIEFKKEGTGRLRPGQRVWSKYLRAIGDDVYLVDSYEQVVAIAAAWAEQHGPATAQRDAAFQ